MLGGLMFGWGTGPPLVALIAARWFPSLWPALTRDRHVDNGGGRVRARADGGMTEAVLLRVEVPNAIAVDSRRSA